MSKPDIIVSWPQHVDYPLWRQFIHDNRDRFAKVIVVFTNMNAGKDYRPWLQQELTKDNVISISNNIVEAKDDWRDVAVKAGLVFSDAEWIWFTEQDFFPQPGFWACIGTLANSYSVMGVYQEDRLHPCCLFISKDLFSQLDKNFSVIPDKTDHFGLMQQQLEKRKDRIGVIHKEYWQHYNGLSQNTYLLQISQEPNYQPNIFKEYCQKCLQISLPIQPEIKLLLEKYVGGEFNEFK